MEVTIVGKALTPISHQKEALFERTSNIYRVPITAGHSVSRRSSEVGFAKPYPHGAPDLTNCVDFILRRPVTHGHPSRSTVPQHEFRKLVESFSKLNLERNEISMQKSMPVPNSAMNVRSIHADMKHTPLSSCGNKQTCARSETVHSGKDLGVNLKERRRDCHSVGGSRKHRKKSNHRRRHRPQFEIIDCKPTRRQQRRTDDIAYKNGKHNQSCPPTEIFIRNKFLPPRAQSSYVMLKNMNKQNGKNDQIILPNHLRSLHRNRNITVDSPPETAFSRGSSVYRDSKDDPLLSSLDSSLDRKMKVEKQLSVRIQLIHKYGNEDVLSKHMEMKRKQEAADKHEKKFLEAQENERLKRVQRAKIYALNNLMTKLEQEQFEDYKQSI